jgi:hypothetical protein
MKVMNCTIAPGALVGQSPGAGAIVPKQSVINLSVSSLSDNQGHRCTLN